MLRIRVLSLSLYGLGFLVLAASLPVSLPLALGIDAIRRKRLATCRLLFFLLVLLNYEAAGVIRAVILWLRWGRHGKEFEERYLRENFELECWWGSSIMLWTQRIYGFTIATRGAEQLASGPYLLFPRHASVGDTVLWPLLVSRLHGIDLRYVVKEELQWDPCLGIVGSRRHHVFVKRGSSDSAGEIARVAQLGRDLGPRDGVLLYPEGTRFTPAKRLRILGKLAAAGDEERLKAAERLEHVLPARLGGPQAVLESAEGVDAIFCAHTGLEGISTPRHLWDGRLVGKTLLLEFWRIPAAEIPRDPQEQAAWIGEQWERVDRWVGEHLQQD